VRNLRRIAGWSCRFGRCSVFWRHCPKVRFWEVWRAAIHVVPGGPISQSWGFVSLEVRIITAKKEALQALCIPKNLAWNAFSFYFKEIIEPINRASETPVN